MSAPAAPLLWRSALVVFLGGAIGTFLRAGLDVVLTDGELSPLTLLACNVTGSFALGIVIRALAPTSGETEGRRRLRLFAGTGLIGGFTSYSAIAVLAGRSIVGGDPVAGGLYALITVIAGISATLISTALVPSRRPERRGGGQAE